MVGEIESISGAEPLVEHAQQNPIVTRYMNEVSYNPTDYSTSRIAEYYSVSTDYKQSHPIGHGVNFSEGGELHFADTERVGKIEVSAGANEVVNAVPDEVTHWWLTANDSVKQSGTVKPTGQVRMIKTTAKNVRDLGGWACDGGTIKYGKIFRGGLLSASDRDVLVGQLGIRHDLDLRGIGDEDAGGNGNITVSPIGDDVTYTAPDTAIYYVLGSKISEWKTILRAIFNAVSNKEPLIFHCAAGSDRTGTVACIVEFLLGVSQGDIDKDYEISSFAIYPEGDRKRTKTEWVGLINEINALGPGNTMRDKVVNWLGNTLGFTADEINAFRRAMIDGTPEDVVVEEPLIRNLADPTSSDWIRGKALNLSAASNTTKEGAHITNYIPCVAGNIIRVKNMDICWLDALTEQTTTAAVMEFYDEDENENKVRIGAIHAYKCCVATDRYNHYIEVGKILDKYTGGAYWPADLSQIRYVRFTGVLLDCAESDVIITVNEVIE
jgi:hypothetical protein